MAFYARYSNILCPIGPNPILGSEASTEEVIKLTLLIKQFFKRELRRKKNEYKGKG